MYLMDSDNNYRNATRELLQAVEGGDCHRALILYTYVRYYPLSLVYDTMLVRLRPPQFELTPKTIHNIHNFFNNSFDLNTKIYGIHDFSQQITEAIERYLKED